MQHHRITVFVVAASLGAGVVALAQETADQPGQGQTEDQTEDRSWEQTDPRYGLLTPLPETGGVPAIVTVRNGPSPAQIETRKQVRAYQRQIRRIRHKYLGPIKVADTRAEGIALILEISDTLAFVPMIEVLAGEADDVRLAMLDHFASFDADGQAALAWVAIHDDDGAVRSEARNRLVKPAERPALIVLDMSLRSADHEVANRAGLVAGTVNALQAIPLLIMAQAAPGARAQTGDLAWIAIERQVAFIAGLIPIAGDGVAAFQPIPGVVTEGVILRVVDAVVIFYRTEIHRSLVSMTTRDWGRPTDHLGYDMGRWWVWYNDEYVPYKNAQARAAQLVEDN